MKSSRIFSGFSCFSTITLLAITAFGLSGARANEWSEVPSQPTPGTPPGDVSQQPQQQQQMFASPNEAVSALRSAVEANDRTALAQIFGPEFTSLQTGDKLQDQKNARHFASAMEE